MPPLPVDLLAEAPRAEFPLAEVFKPDLVLEMDLNRTGVCALKAVVELGADLSGYMG